MAKVKRKEAVAAGPSMKELIARASERVAMSDELWRRVRRVSYQDDVDTLVLRFAEGVSARQIPTDDEEGVIGIFDGKKIVGLEILDITGNLENANPR